MHNFFCGARCYKCNITFEMDYTPSKKELLKAIRAAGWSVGSKIQCKDCRPNSEMNRYMKIKDQLMITKFVHLETEAFSKKEHAMLAKIREANLTAEHETELKDRLFDMRIFRSVEKSINNKNNI